jgi:hypothetical protein
MSDASTAVMNPADPPQIPRTAPLGDAPSSASGRVAELRVSGNLMTLEAGLFCVFPVPGSPMPDPTTGLPGVRVSLAPGLTSRPDAVEISTFREDGWLDGTAALVRVTEGPAQVLVTIYQNPLQPREAAPKLQVMRLDGPPVAAPAPARLAAAPAADALELEATAHVQATGDVGGQIGDWIGTRGSRLWVEGFAIRPQSLVAPSDIEYQAVLGRGWLSPWVEGGKFCGSRGMALPLLGLKVRLKGEAAQRYRCTYSATFIDGSTMGPLEAGETCEAESLAAMEAFQIELQPQLAQHVDLPRTASAASPALRAARAKAPVRSKARVA